MSFEAWGDGGEDRYYNDEQLEEAIEEAVTERTAELQAELKRLKECLSDGDVAKKVLSAFWRRQFREDIDHSKESTAYIHMLTAMGWVEMSAQRESAL